MMKKILVSFLFVAFVTGVASADVTWDWSFASEAGTFVTNGVVGAGGVVAPGTYALLDGTSSFMVTASVVGGLLGNNYTAGTAYNGTAPFTFDWDGSSATKWDCGGSLGAIRDWLPIRHNTITKYDYIFGFDDVDKNISFPGRAALYDNTLSVRKSFVEGDIALAPVPEPATIALLSFGALALIRRKK